MPDIRRRAVRKISEFCIAVGYSCNFNCAHCGVSLKRGLALSAREVRLLISTILKHKFGSLLFVGGEPTLYIGKINTILSGIEGKAQPGVIITTNGHFAGTEASAIHTLLAFNRLHSVQLSYDKFHKKFLPPENIKNLYSACKELKMDFRVLLSIESPLELVIAKELRSAGDFPVAVQKVHSIGEAARNKIATLYPSLDKTVLKKRCPNRTKLVYMCGEGFTTCCSYLAFQKDPSEYVHKTLAAHLRSPFYSAVSRLTFSGLMRKFKIPIEGLLPEHSEPCNLCRHIFQNSAAVLRA